jgi:Ca-activated chloride channel family protein
MPPDPNKTEGNKAHKKPRALIVAMAITVVILILGVFWLTTQRPGLFSNPRESETMSEVEANRILNELYSSIQVSELPTLPESEDLAEEDLTEILPDISKYPLQVRPVENTFSVEIASSPEKAAATGPRYNRWLVEMANEFNRSKISLKGKPVSVSVRALPSGVAMDFIVSGKYIPDAYSPSNQLWGEALRAKGVSSRLLVEKLAGNVAGLVIAKSKSEDFIRKYQAIKVESVAKAVTQGSFVMGYANPLASSTGANFLLTLLHGINPKNPLSPESRLEFERFQSQIPFVAYTTLQMTEAAKSGVFDGFVYESQQFVNSPELRSAYVFSPFGVRHDNPVYALGDLRREKIELLTMFITFCRFPKSQELATEYGFNRDESYQGDDRVKGQLLPQAQALFKARKTGNRQVVMVFVADVSGSLAGAPLRLLKRSLIQGSKAIGPNNYVGLVQFSDQPQIAAPLRRFDLNQRAIFTGAVNNMSAGGGAAMIDGIIVAAKMIQDLKPSLPQAKPMIIVLADDETVEGRKFEEIAPMTRGLGIPIHTIGYNANLQTLKKISALNKAANLTVDTDDIVYQLRNFFNAEM